MSSRLQIWATTELEIIGDVLGNNRRKSKEE